MPNENAIHLKPRTWRIRLPNRRGSKEQIKAPLHLRSPMKSRWMQSGTWRAVWWAALPFESVLTVRALAGWFVELVPASGNVQFCSLGPSPGSGASGRLEPLAAFAPPFRDFQPPRPSRSALPTVTPPYPRRMHTVDNNVIYGVHTARIRRAYGADRVSPR